MVVMLVVFIGFASISLKEMLAWNYLAAFGLIGRGRILCFRIQRPETEPPGAFHQKKRPDSHQAVSCFG